MSLRCGNNLHIDHSAINSGLEGRCEKSHIRVLPRVHCHTRGESDQCPPDALPRSGVQASTGDRQALPPHGQGAGDSHTALPSTSTLYITFLRRLLGMGSVSLGTFTSKEQFPNFYYNYTDN